MSKADTYEDFVAWRDSHDCEQVTVGDAMRWFTGTPIAGLLEWWKRDRAEQEAKALEGVTEDIITQLVRLGCPPDERHAVVSRLAGRELGKPLGITLDEAVAVVRALARYASLADLEMAGAS